MMLCLNGFTNRFGNGTNLSFRKLREELTHLFYLEITNGFLNWKQFHSVLLDCSFSIVLVCVHIIGFILIVTNYLQLYVWCDYYLVIIYLIYFNLILFMLECESRIKDLYLEWDIHICQTDDQRSVKLGWPWRLLSEMLERELQSIMSSANNSTVVDRSQKSIMSFMKTLNRSGHRKLSWHTPLVTWQELAKKFILTRWDLFERKDELAKKGCL